MIYSIFYSLLNTTAYYISFYIHFYYYPNPFILLFILLFGGLSCYFVKKLSTVFKSIFFKSLTIVFYSKTIYEISIIIKQYINIEKRINMSILILLCLNIIRGIFKGYLSLGFNNNKKLYYYSDIIKIEKLISQLYKKYNNSVRDEGFKEYDPEIMFGILCNDPIINQIADKMFIISGIYRSDNEVNNSKISNKNDNENISNNKIIDISNNEIANIITTNKNDNINTNTNNIIKTDNIINTIKTEKIINNIISSNCIVDLKYNFNISKSAIINQKSISRLFNNNESLELLKIFTQNFDDYLNFPDFYECIRQINFERKSYLNFLLGNEYVLKMLKRATWILYFWISGFIIGQIFKVDEFANDFTKFIMYPITLFLFPCFVNMLDSFIFIIYVHPYDIEDRILVDSDNLIVKSIGLSSTIFEKWNNEVVIYSNRVLKDKVLNNIRRSKNQHKILSILINISDRLKIGEVERILKDYSIKNNEFTGFELVMDKIIDSRFIKVDFIIIHSINHQNGYYMWVVQNRFMKKVAEVLKEVRIEYSAIEIPLDISYKGMIK